MIKAKHPFFCTSKSEGYGFYGKNATILYLTSKYFSLSVLSVKLYFIEIGPIPAKLWSFECMMMKTLNSNFLEWKVTFMHLDQFGSVAGFEEITCVGWSLKL